MSLALVLSAAVAQIASGNLSSIGRIQPSNMSPAGPQGIAFDRAGDPLIIDGFGRAIWRISRSDARVLETYPLAGGEANTRSLAYDARAGRYLSCTSRSDFELTSIDAAGVAKEIGVIGRINFFSTTMDHAGTLWAVDDCRDPGCMQGQGARLSRLDTTNGTRTMVRDLGSALGQATAIAVTPSGSFYIATFGSDGYARLWVLKDIRAQPLALGRVGLGSLSILTAMTIDPVTGDVFAIEEQRGAEPRTWNLVRIAGHAI